MPKRIGYLYEQVLSLENCTNAVLIGTKNLKKTPKIRRIRENADKWGQRILDALSEGWVPAPTREKEICDGVSGKRRTLNIPSTFDHLCHVAIMLPIIDLLIKRFDFYCCGSVPGRGPKRVEHTIKSWMNSEHPIKYAGEADIHHAYETTSSDTVMAALRRFIKDEKYLSWHEQILQQMGGYLAIGFQPSHWYFNLVMSRWDRIIRNHCKGLKMVRYMDNYWFGSNRKRRIHKAIAVLKTELERLGMELNHAYQVFPTAFRAITALSYRYFEGYSIMRKVTMLELSKQIRIAGRKMTAHLSRSAMSRIGVLRSCNSYSFRKHYVYPIFSIKRAKELISRADKRRLLRQKA